MFNKIDQFTYVPRAKDDLMPMKRENISIEDLKKTWMNELNNQCVFISAKDRTNIEELRTMIYEQVKSIHVKRYPYNDFLY